MALRLPLWSYSTHTLSQKYLQPLELPMHLVFQNADWPSKHNGVIVPSTPHVLRHGRINWFSYKTKG